MKQIKHIFVLLLLMSGLWNGDLIGRRRIRVIIHRKKSLDNRRNNSDISNKYLNNRKKFSITLKRYSKNNKEHNKESLDNRQPSISKKPLNNNKQPYYDQWPVNDNMRMALRMQGIDSSRWRDVDDNTLHLKLPIIGNISVDKAELIKTIIASPAVAYGIHKMIASLANTNNSNANAQSSVCANNDMQSRSENSVYAMNNSHDYNVMYRSGNVHQEIQPEAVKRVRLLMIQGSPYDECASQRSAMGRQLKRITKKAVYTLENKTSQFFEPDTVFNIRSCSSAVSDDMVNSVCNQMLDLYQLEVASIVIEPTLTEQEKKRLLARAFLNFLRNITPDQYVEVLRDVCEQTPSSEARNTLYAMSQYLTRHKVLFWLRPRYGILPNFFSFIFEDLARGPQERIICKGLDSTPHQVMFDKIQKLDSDERKELFKRLASNNISKAYNYVQNENIRLSNKQRRYQEMQAAQQVANRVKQAQQKPDPVQQQPVATPVVQPQQKTTPVQQSPPVAAQKEEEHQAIQKEQEQKQKAEQESQENVSNDLLDAINNNIEALAEPEQADLPEYRSVELDKKTIGIINDIGIDAAAFEQLPIAVEFHQAHMRFMHDLNWHTHRGLEEQSDIGKIMYAAGFEHTTFLAQLNKEGQLSCYAQHEERIRSTPELWVGTIKSVLRISKKFGCAMADSLLHEVSNPIALTEKLVCGQLYFVGNCIGFVRKCISVSATTLYHCATDIPGTCESIVTITQQVTHAIKKIPYQEIGKWVDGLPSVAGHDIAQGIHNTMQKLENNDALIEGVAHFATDIMINNAGIKFWRGVYNTGILSKGTKAVKDAIDCTKAGEVVNQINTKINNIRTNIKNIRQQGVSCLSGEEKFANRLMEKCGLRVRKLKEITPKVMEETKGIHLAEHRYKHEVGKIDWKKIVESTEFGDAKFKPEINVEYITRFAWKHGEPARNGKNFKVIKFDEIIGAKKGIETQYMRVEMSANTIHGHPIPVNEFINLLKDRA